MTTLHQDATGQNLNCLCLPKSGLHVDKKKKTHKIPFMDDGLLLCLTRACTVEPEWIPKDSKVESSLIHCPQYIKSEKNLQQ